MSKLTITNIRKASAEEWDKHWINCAYATYFQSREWAEIWEAYSEGKLIAYAEHFFFSDGKEAVLPASIVKMYKGLEQQYIMSAAGTYGGWISEQKLDGYHVKLLINHLSNKNLQWRINPYDESLEGLSFQEEKKDATNVLILNKDFEGIFRKWSKGHNSAAKKAKREGVKVLLANNEDEWKVYYEIYEKSLERWGDKATSNYKWNLFKKLFEVNSPNIKLWLATYKANLAAGALCFYAQKHVVYWHGAADDEYFNLRPIHYLLQEAIKDACEKGYQWFDFNPSGGHEGVRKFKRGFATEEMPCSVIMCNSIKGQLFKNMNDFYKRLAISI